MTRVIAVIPARMGSTRFPGKPLAPICGRPMLEHVYCRTRACGLLEDVIVATCDEGIARAAAAFGARVVMTSDKHERASDRVAEVAGHVPADIIVMVQGDEPLIRPELIEAAVAPMLVDETIACVNLSGAIVTERELHDRNTIKLVTGRDGRVLYFSRQPIPDMGGRPFEVGPWRKQVCVIPFRRAALEAFAGLPRGSLEELESIDMLRFLENGLPVLAVATSAETHAVDVPADVEVVTRIMARHPWPEGEPTGVRG